MAPIPLTVSVSPRSLSPSCWLYIDFCIADVPESCSFGGAAEDTLAKKFLSVWGRAAGRQWSAGQDRLSMSRFSTAAGQQLSIALQQRWNPPPPPQRADPNPLQSGVFLRSNCFWGVIKNAQLHHIAFNAPAAALARKRWRLKTKHRQKGTAQMTLIEICLSRGPEVIDELG